MKTLTGSLSGIIIFLQIALSPFAVAAPTCPSLEEVRQRSFEHFRRYDRGEEANLFAYDATVKLEDGWLLRMQFYSTTPSTVEKANAMKQKAGHPRGPHQGGDIRWFCGYEVALQPGIKMVALTAEKW